MRAQTAFGAVIGLGLTGCLFESDDSGWEEGYTVRASVTADTDFDRVLGVLTPVHGSRVIVTATRTPPGKLLYVEHEEVWSTIFDRLVVIGFRGDAVIGAAISDPLEYDHTAPSVAEATASLQLDPSASVEVFGMPADCVRVTVGTRTIESTRWDDADCDGEPDAPPP